MEKETLEALYDDTKTSIKDSILNQESLISDAKTIEKDTIKQVEDYQLPPFMMLNIINSMGDVVAHIKEKIRETEDSEREFDRDYEERYSEYQ